MSAQQAELSTDPGRATTDLLAVDDTGKEDGSQIAVAESVEDELAAVDCFQQGPVIGQGTKGTHPASAPLPGLFQMLEQLVQSGRFIDGRESIQVALGRLAGDLGSA